MATHWVAARHDTPESPSVPFSLGVVSIDQFVPSQDSTSISGVKQAKDVPPPCTMGTHS